jgi:hypothetical protein
LLSPLGEEGTESLAGVGEEFAPGWNAFCHSQIHSSARQMILDMEVDMLARDLVRKRWGCVSRD